MALPQRHPWVLMLLYGQMDLGPWRLQKYKYIILSDLNHLERSGMLELSMLNPSKLEMYVCSESQLNRSAGSSS